MASSIVAPKRARGPRGLPVYICEYHDEALRCIHHAIRKRHMPFDGLTMVHLDAHPDLSASATMPAETVFKSPHEVYYALRSDPGGIAQWILPAVYGGHFRCVWWVRPAWALQIADGDYDVTVGGCARPPDGGHESACSGARRAGGAGPALRGRDACTPGASLAPNGAPGKEAAKLGAALERVDEEPPKTIRISSREPYFVEDGLFCPTSAQAEPKPLRMLVSQLPSAEGAIPLLEAAGCGPGEQRPRQAASGSWTLDVCLDYFACGNPFLSRTRPRIAAPFAAVQNGASFRRRPVEDEAAFLAERDAFDAAYSAVLRGSGERGGLDAAPAGDGSLDTLLGAVGRFLPEDERVALLADLRTALGSARDSELQQILEAGDMVTLPLHAVTEEEIKERLAAFQAFVARLCSDAGLGSRPGAVTIARSVVDGFCPMRWLCTLERGVLEVLQLCFGTLGILYSDELDALEVQ
uniref:Uncharacterized protein n=1 Tax=Alexandrium catenella TaxID=2925 RepID=A0A7S1W2N2_ALECA